MSRCLDPQKMISNEDEASARAAQFRYHNYLDEQKRKKVSKQHNLKRKLTEESVNVLKNKKVKIEKAMAIMLKEANEMSIKAENLSDFSLLAKSNVFRKKVTESAEVSKLSKEIDEISKAL